jgi:uncharacterized protein (TIGR03437 family)
MPITVQRLFAVVMILAPATGDLLALDKVRVETHVDDAVAKFGVSGKGVIFAMLDRGIDWQTNDFRNADGTTRIAYIFDLTDNTGAKAANNLYGKGTIYTRDQINGALQSGTRLATRDAVGHGTANTAIAAGNGRNSNGKYRGIAPQATIIAVKLVSDGVPAHDDQAAEAAFYDPTLIPVALDFVRDKATELGMPCVMVLDIGSQGGPTDGTSSLARKIDSTVGTVPGLVIIPGAGDDGGQANRAAGSVSAGGRADLHIQKGAGGALVLDLWYSGNDRFDVAIQTPDSTYGPFVAPSNSSFDFRTNLAEVAYYHYGNTSNGWGSTNGKRELYISLNGPTGSYTVTLTGATVVDGHFDATLNPSDEWNTSKSNVFLNFVAPGSISDLASAHNAIVDTCYVVRTTWIDIDGITRTQTGQGDPGDLWVGTSVGPTFDGRIGIDVSAPANNIITAYAPKSNWATFRGNLISDGNGLYGLAGANSSSNPVVAGVIALMLELNPHLDALTIKGILQKSARVDSFTGSVPSSKWGYGKIDALAALSLVVTGQTNQLSSKNSASFASGVPLAPDVIGFAEASGIASALVVAPDGPWPPTLGGVHLDITDSQAQTRPAPIYFVTTNSMGFLIPTATALGRATVKLTTSTGAIISGTLDINRVSPGLYTANASGSGVPAGFWIRAGASGAQSYDYLFDPAKLVGSRDAVPVDLGGASDQVFLSLYGTGFRGASSASATVGGLTVPVSGFAAVGIYQGEDVINIGPLPRALAARGPVDILISFDGQVANTVTVSIR